MAARVDNAAGAQERYRAILKVIRAIPAGRVASYGQLAAMAGLPRRARMVGRLLRETEEKLPWHRVVTAQGRIAFAPGSELFALQCERLQDEGVACLGGRVDLDRFGWRHNLDELLWGPQ